MAQQTPHGTTVRAPGGPRPLRSKAMLLAPFIPIWAITGFLGLTEFAGTHYLLPFVVVWGAAAIALFVYALRQAMSARRAQASRSAQG